MTTSRRWFVGAASALASGRVAGANGRVGVGFIGYGLIGGQHVYDFKNQSDADLVALAEVHRGRLDEGVTACGGRTKAYTDFRRMLDDKDVQAVVVSTPDHWHALMTMMACAAGKDVYVEKPMTLFFREGRWMIDVARRHNRIVMVGTQQRSGKHYQKAMGLISEGYIGKVHSARMGFFRNIMPGFGRPAGAQPAEFDYDLWLGPAPKHPYSPHRGLYHFRWFWDYSGGQMTNLAAHSLDILQWYMDVKGPSAVSSTGGRFALEDDGETPDTQDALLEYPGFTAAWSHREASAGTFGFVGDQFFGTKGTLTIGRGGYRVSGDPKVEPEQRIPRFRGGTGAHPGPRPAPVELWVEAVEEKGSSEEQFDLHVKDFLDCVRTRRRPIASVEDGHYTATACHLANIALRVKRRIAWEPEKEEILGDREASSYLERSYRAPWDKVLRSLLS
jgi:predicted dehydrogenase